MWPERYWSRFWGARYWGHTHPANTRLWKLPSVHLRFERPSEPELVFEIDESAPVLHVEQEI